MGVKKRRAVKGAGSVMETTDQHGRHRWTIQYFLAGRTAPVRRRQPLCTHRKPSAWECQRCYDTAWRQLEELKKQAARGELDTPKEAKPEAPKLPTLADWLETWLERGGPGGRKGDPSPRTLALYAGLIRNDIAPAPIGSMRLDEIRKKDVRAFLDDLAHEKDRSLSAISKELGCMTRAYRLALETYDEELSEDRPNPFDVSLPAGIKKKGQRRSLAVVDHEGAIHVDEIHRLLAAVKGNALLEAWVRLGIDCAARPGELAALTWADLDLKAKPATVTITKAIVWEPDEHGRTVARLTAGKTATEEHPHRGHRRVTISPSTVAALKAYREHRLTLFRGHWPDDQDGIALADRVFRTDGGKLVDHHLVRRQLQAVAEKAELGSVNPYDLRHTGATLVAAVRQDKALAARLLGHVSGEAGGVTQGYLHLGLDVIDSTVLDDALAPKKSTPHHQEAQAQ